ncbi:MAG: bifunctional riboflavin kinase/FAD synthetase [Pseudomonadota bacterium]
MVAGSVAAIGNFDGVHRGHRALLEAASGHAASLSAPLGVVVFDPHPRRFFRPDDPAFMVMTPHDRDALLRGAGVASVARLPFNDALSQMTPAEFVHDVLAKQLGLRGVITGREFRFGKGRAGDTDALASLCQEAGISAFALDPVPAQSGGQKIGSSAIRTALQAGDVGDAADMLGRPWSVYGVIEEGQKLGRQIGFPTANMRLGDIIEPKFGVYAIEIALEAETELSPDDATTLKGVANFGRRPTVGSDAPLLEVHIFDFTSDLYGKALRVYFRDFIRPEMKFDGVGALTQQIARDVEAARAFFATGGA